MELRAVLDGVEILSATAEMARLAARKVGAGIRRRSKKLRTRREQRTALLFSRQKLLKRTAPRKGSMVRHKIRSWPVSRLDSGNWGRLPRRRTGRFFWLLSLFFFMQKTSRNKICSAVFTIWLQIVTNHIIHALEKIVNPKI